MKFKKFKKKDIIMLLITAIISAVIISFVYLKEGFFYFSQHPDYRKVYLYDLHEKFKASGYYGHGFAIVGVALLMIGLIYHIKKRHKKFFGKQSFWLDIHISFSIIASILMLFHSNFLFGNISGVFTFVTFFITSLTGFLIYFIIYTPKVRKIIYYIHYYGTVLMFLSLFIHAFYYIYLGFKWIF